MNKIYFHLISIFSFIEKIPSNCIYRLHDYGYGIIFLYNMVFPEKLGKKIAVIWVTGAGKSTLARILGREFDLPVYHTDKFSWADGREKARSNEEITKYVDTILSKTERILEGYLWYVSLPDLRLRQADCVIFLDYSRRRLARHVLKRTIQHHGKKRPEMPDNCIEWFGRHTITWIWRYYTKKDLRKNVQNRIAHVEPEKILRFTSPYQLNKRLQVLN